MSTRRFDKGVNCVDALRILVPHAASPLIWALIPAIALGADALARALPRAGSSDTPARWPHYPPWRERAPFLTAVFALLALAWWRFGPSQTFLGTAGGGIALLVVAAIDWRHHVIFERVLLAGVLGSLGVAALDLPATARLVESVVAGGLTLAFTSALFLALRVCYRPVLPGDRTPLGFGDVLLAAMLGTMLGRQVVWALVLGTGLAGVATLIAVVAGRLQRHDPVPLGSFLCWGALIVLLCR